MINLRAFFLLLLSTLGLNSFAQNVYLNNLPATDTGTTKKINLYNKNGQQSLSSGNWTLHRHTQISSANWTYADLEKLSSGNWSSVDTKAMLASGNWSSSEVTRYTNSAANWTMAKQQNRGANEWSSDEITQLIESGNYKIQFNTNQ